MFHADMCDGCSADLRAGHFANSEHAAAHCVTVGCYMDEPRHGCPGDNPRTLDDLLGPLCADCDAIWNVGPIIRRPKHAAPRHAA